MLSLVGSKNNQSKNKASLALEATTLDWKRNNSSYKITATFNPKNTVTSLNTDTYFLKLFSPRCFTTDRACCKEPSNDSPARDDLGVDELV